MKSNNLRIHCLIHVSFEGIGHIESWAKKHNYHLSYTYLFEEVSFPSKDEFDMLIIMGGPMNIYEEELYPWLVPEKKFIREAIESDKTVIGFCLGSQLIADVLGGKITSNKDKEIGWFPIVLTDEAKNTPIFPNQDLDFSVFHWHGDTFSLPQNSVKLASSRGCGNQAFLYNERVVGLQFHLEVTPESLDEMIKNGKSELQDGKYIQSAQEMKNNTHFISQCNDLLENILDQLSKN
ncbi:GMP synthase-like glutamine amidotransferase [Dysgonomonas alginatilytica]|uniref:GMP synthase-like glutamine amidotransferase n=1 Tax=Dysgonomonas alginatilytica TaxID=1605892 RepID=A0A2V3PSW9_9BACT|nr:type 1 glutamine amidotransferase [Dysgonomonas alginatilytica]PXV62179.1 GMP synthase-like glutamine amidotransferase [Dysgonomonas alginatilytica]